MAGTARLEQEQSGSGSDGSRLLELVRAAQDDFEHLCDDVTGDVFAAVPALAAGADLRAEVIESAAAGIEQLLELLADLERPLDEDPPAPLLGLVRSLVRRDARPADLLQASRVAQNAVWRRLLDGATAAIPPGPELAGVLQLASSRLFARTDAVVDRLMRVWLEEHEAWAGGAAARRSALVRELVAGSSPADPRRLGLGLDRPLCAAVLWDEREPDAEAALRGLEALARTCGGDGALAVPGGGAVLWAWLAAPDGLDALAAAVREAAGEGQCVALGTPGRGLEGFRRGHAEAQSARRVAVLARRGARVVRYDEVEPVSLMTHDLGRLARFVDRMLGELAAPTRQAERLRGTLRVWLATGGSAPAAALRLGVHKNTVLYRVHRASVLLPRPVEEDRLGVELALAAAEEVGLDALRAAAPVHL